MGCVSIVYLLWGQQRYGNAEFFSHLWIINTILRSLLGGSSTSGTATAVNGLATLFQILYIPGTYKAAKVLKGNRIRDAILQGMTYTFIGNLLRYFTANAYSQRDAFDEAFESSTLNYIVIFIGTALVAIAQPIFLNTPTLVALVWFSVSERELAMTLLTLNNALGNAIGSILPSIMVPPLSPSVNQQDLRVNISFLLLVQFSASFVGLLFSYVLFANQPRPAHQGSRKAQRGEP